MDSNKLAGTALPNQRFGELDSLRGLAALTVAIHHFLPSMDPGTAKYIYLTPFRVFTRGHQSVILFFLLSGFVLSLPYLRNKGSSYPAFLAKRICRIYLPYLAALVLAVALNYHFHGMVTVHADTWQSKPTIVNIEQHVLFLGDYSWASFNLAFWSLIYEMRISLAFPFIAFVVLRFGSVKLIAFSLFLSLIPGPLLLIVPTALPIASSLRASTLVMTLHYTSFFIIGALLAKHRIQVAAQLAKMNSFAIGVCTLMALIAWITTIHWESTANRLWPLEQLQDWVTACGAAFFLVGALAFRRFRTFLHIPIVHHMGQISYSLYLVHGSILMVLVYLFHDRLPGYMLPVYLLTVLIVSDLFNRGIEKPTMRLGRKLGEALESRKS
jgi:peptidoglycan/LPS O-acetylase OafA/YrhL